MEIGILLVFAYSLSAWRLHEIETLLTKNMQAVRDPDLASIFCS